MRFEYLEVSFINPTGEVEENNFKVHSIDELHELLDKYPEDCMRKVGYVRCECGEVVACLSHTNACDCGTDYNAFGQRLAPREQWGYETGETLADIMGF